MNTLNRAFLKACSELANNDICPPQINCCKNCKECWNSYLFLSATELELKIENVFTKSGIVEQLYNEIVTANSLIVKELAKGNEVVLKNIKGELKVFLQKKSRIK